MLNRFELVFLLLLPSSPSPFKGEGEENANPPTLRKSGRRGKAAGLLLFALCLPGVAFAAAPVAASNAWIRWLPGQIPLGGYVTLHNPGAHALTIVGASSPAFKRVELHRSMTMTNGMETMKPVAAVTIPAGAKFSFAPGGYHLMLWRKQPIKVGDKLPIVFEFKNGSRLRVVFTVKGATQ